MRDAPTHRRRDRVGRISELLAKLKGAPMTVLNIEKNLAAVTLTVTSTFDASLERMWQLWADPRQLERWWGPPEWPATVVDHDLSPGGTVRHFMTGPDGDKAAGWWQIVSVDPPRSLELDDGFADADGNPNLALPVTRMRVDLSSDGPKTATMIMTSQFPSVEAMQQVIDMGMEEGLRAAMGQIDSILAEG